MTTEATAPRPICGRFTLAFAFLAVFSPLVIGFLFVGAENAREPAPTSGPEAQREAWGWLGRLVMGFVAAVVAAGLAALGGVVTGVLAISRGERPVWLAWFGLSICATILVLLIGAYMNGQQ
ncbi:MAG: hypothetical protein K8U57_21180 [Planctomycetes bacterium]|nr:hypothetical protein [Planctomycetota bacterium]